MGTSVYTQDNLTANTETTLTNGDINEFVNSLSQVNIYAVTSLLNGLRISVFADSDIAIDNKIIPVTGTSIDNSAALIDSFVVAPGSRMFIKLRENTGVSTTDGIVKMEVIPLA